MNEWHCFLQQEPARSATQIVLGTNSSPLGLPFSYHRPLGQPQAEEFPIRGCFFSSTLPAAQVNKGVFVLVVASVLHLSLPPPPAPSGTLGAQGHLATDHLLLWNQAPGLGLLYNLNAPWTKTCPGAVSARPKCGCHPPSVRTSLGLHSEPPPRPAQPGPPWWTPSSGQP